MPESDDGVMRFDITPITFSELPDSRILTLLNLLVLKTLRMKDSAICDYPTVAELGAYRCAEPEIAAESRERVAGWLADLAQEGFSPPVWYEVNDAFNSAQFHVGILANPSRDCFARVLSRVWTNPTPRNVVASVGIHSVLEGGTFLSAFANKNDLKLPANIRAEYLGEATAVPDLLKRHLQSRAGARAIPLPDEESALLAAEAHHAGVAQEYMRRKFFVPLTAEERDLLKRSRIPGEHAKHSDVYLQMLRESAGKRSAVSTLAILAVSVLLFVNLQSGAGTWQSLALLVGVLFIHEAGHFLTMKLFGYRDVRMFFIPFLGAAVMGRRVAAAQWKQSLVALAGPLPGIALGIGVGIAAGITDNPLLYEASVLFLVLNTFNLAPLLPFDGGRVLNAVLYSRSPVLEVVAQGFAVLALLGLGMVLDTRVLLPLGVMLAISLPVTWRTAVLSRELRSSGALEHAEGAEVPPLAAGVIIDRLRSAPAGSLAAQGLNRATLATLAGQVYDRTASRPPSVLPTLGLLTLYAGGVVMGLLSAGVVILAKEGLLMQTVQLAARQPRHTLSAAQLQAWDGAESCARKDHLTVVATCSEMGDPEQLFQRTKSALPPQAALRQAGRTVMILLPADDAALRQEWVARMEAERNDVFVVKPGASACMDFLVTLPDAKAAEEFEETLKTYFAVASFKVIAPWNPEDTRDAATRIRHENARKTYRTLTDWSPVSGKDTELEAIYKDLSAASRKGDDARRMELNKHLQETFAARQRKKVESARAAPYAHEGLIAAFEKNVAIAYPEDGDAAALKAYNAQQQAYIAYVSEECGARPLGAEGKPPPWNWDCDYATVSRTVNVVEISSCGFEDIGNAAPAMVKWLFNHGCRKIQYEVYHGYNGLDEAGTDAPRE
jgi:Zn-dependent protease